MSGILEIGCKGSKIPEVSYNLKFLGVLQNLKFQFPQISKILEITVIVAIQDGLVIPEILENFDILEVFGFSCSSDSRDSKDARNSGDSTDSKNCEDSKDFKASKD